MTNWKEYEKVETKILIDYCQDSQKAEQVRDAVFLALCFRFRKDLLQKCEVICKRRGYDIDVANLIAEKSFKKYGKSKNFKIEKCNHSTVDICFKVYLYKIAGNVLNDYYKRGEKKKKGLLYEGTEAIIKNMPDIDIDCLTPKDKIIHETLQSLPHSHQVIYLTYTQYEKKGVNLPRKLLKELRDYLGISQNTIRCYKKEAIDKMEDTKKIISQMQKVNEI